MRAGTMLLDHTNFKSLSSQPAFALLLERIRARRASFRENKKIDGDIVDLMKKAGVYRAMVAERYGGYEWSPAQFLRMIEEISRAEG